MALSYCQGLRQNSISTILLRKSVHFSDGPIDKMIRPPLPHVLWQQEVDVSEI